MVKKDNIPPLNSSEGERFFFKQLMTSDKKKLAKPTVLNGMKQKQTRPRCRVLLGLR